MITFIDQNTAKKKKFFHQVFHPGGLQKISTNPEIIPDLYTFTEEILVGKLQNRHDFCW